MSAAAPFASVSFAESASVSDPGVLKAEFASATLSVPLSATEAVVSPFCFSAAPFVRDSVVSAASVSVVKVESPSPEIVSEAASPARTIVSASTMPLIVPAAPALTVSVSAATDEPSPSETFVSKVTFPAPSSALTVTAPSASNSVVR